MKVILSIKPKYANLILSGDKKYELRKTIFKDSSVQTVLIYASSPISKVIGEFDIEHIIHDDINSLWDKTKALSAVDKDFFDSYFSGRNKGYAIAVKNIKKYDTFLDINKDFGHKAPQSFVYIKD